MLDEKLPTGPDWPADLLNRVSHEVGNRPAILNPDVAEAAEETRRFRHVATRSYNVFRPTRAAPAVEAAQLLVGRLAGEIAAFKHVIDPD